jgi:hypothetical protein
MREALPRSAHGNPLVVIAAPHAKVAGRCSEHIYTRILWVYYLSISPK